MKQYYMLNANFFGLQHLLLGYIIAWRVNEKDNMMTCQHKRPYRMTVPSSYLT